MKRNTLFVAILAAPLLAASIAPAETLTAIDATDSNNLPQLIAVPSDRIFGWEFSPQAEIAITEIGWLDVGGDGLVDSHEIGIWTSAGELLHSAVVSSSDELDGPLRYVSIPALTLIPLESYVIAGVQPRYRCVPEQAGCYDEPPSFVEGTQILTDPLALQLVGIPVDDHITLLAGRSGSSVDAALAFPGDVYDLSNGIHVGPNFRFAVVPEPSGIQIAMAAIGCLLLLRVPRVGMCCRAMVKSTPVAGGRAMRCVFATLAAITLQFAMALPDAAAATLEYSFTPIEFPGAESTDVHGINDAGVIVGSYSLADKIHGFVFDGAAFTTIDFPNAVGTSARGINDQGQIVGRFFLDDRAMLGGGFLFNGDSYEAINFPGASSTTAFDINNAGDIVGGYSETPGHNRGFTFDGASFTSVEYPGAGSSRFAGVNNHGTVVGTFSDAGIVLFRSEGFVFDGVNFEIVDIPGARFTVPLDINDEGVIVGYFTHEFLGVTKGFILDEDGQTNVNVPGSLLTYVQGINNNRDIVGTFIDSSLEKHSYLGTPVPEPSSLCLLLSACMGAVCPRRFLRSRVNRPGSRH